MRTTLATITVAGTIASIGVLLGHQLHASPDREQTAQAPVQEEPAPRTELPHRDDASRRGIDALADEVAQLRAEVAQLRSEVGRGADAPVDEPEISPEEAQLIWDDHMSLVEAGFHEEPTDARWAGDTSALIKRALSGRPSLQSVARSTECRSQTCRVELDTDADGKLADEISALTRTLGEQLPTVRYDRFDTQGGRQTQVLYFSREGAEAAPADTP